MLLRYLSPLIALCLFFGCKPKNIEPLREELHKVEVLSLFKPTKAEISFPMDVYAKADNDNFIRIPKNSIARIELLNSQILVSINNKVYSTNGLIFYTDNKNPLYDRFEINLPGCIKRKYNGGLEIKPGNNEISFIILQKTEDLVLGVLSSESNDDQMEYLKSLSVIIRTYILFNHSRHLGEGYDFCDNTHCMVFYGEQNKSRIFASAVKATKGQTLKYNNGLIDVYFTGSCGGITKTPNEVWNNYGSVYPYSPIQCGYCGVSRHKDWSWVALKSQFVKIFPGSKKIINILSSKQNNSLEFVTISTDKGNIILSKDELRLSIGRLFGWNKIYSDNYSFFIKNDSIFFTGHGFGHCIGFCQSGAEEMSRLGKTYKEILLYYYPKASF